MKSTNVCTARDQEMKKWLFEQLHRRSPAEDDVRRILLRWPALAHTGKPSMWTAEVGWLSLPTPARKCVAFVFPGSGRTLFGTSSLAEVKRTLSRFQPLLNGKSRAHEGDMPIPTIALRGSMTNAAEKQRAGAYFFLLGAQTVAVAWIFWFVLPIFRQFLNDIGREQDLGLWDELAIAGGAIILQALYWVRLHFLRVWTPIRNMFVAHVIKFASRASFFFGGAFFSTIFFRHIPELDALPPIGQGLARVTLVLAVLFSLFCYSLELDRLGHAMEASDNPDV
jgi:hypothetical protein